GETEYLIVTDKTRVPGIVRKDSAGRAEQDIETVFSEHPTSIEPKTNPFGNVPLPPKETPPKPPGAGSGSAATPAGGAAPTPQGETKGAAPAKGDAPKAPATPPAKADAPKAPAPPPAKSDAPKPPTTPP